MKPSSGLGRRFSLRIPARLRAVIASSGAAEETTQTENISTDGTLLLTSSERSPGERLRLRIEQEEIDVDAQVIHSTRLSTRKYRVGLQVLGISEAWIRLFVSCVAREQALSSRTKR